MPTTQVRWLLDYLAPATTVELYDAPLGLGMSFFLSLAKAAKVVSLHERSARGSKKGPASLNGYGVRMWFGFYLERAIVSQLLKTEVEVTTLTLIPKLNRVAVRGFTVNPNT